MVTEVSTQQRSQQQAASPQADQRHLRKLAHGAEGVGLQLLQAVSSEQGRTGRPTSCCQILAAMADLRRRPAPLHHAYHPTPRRHALQPYEPEGMSLWNDACCADTALFRDMVLSFRTDFSPRDPTA